MPPKLDENCVQLNRGAFTISLDFELIWGTLDLFGPSGFREACEKERLLIERLLDLFVEYEIPATWCILGHLFLKECGCSDGRKHPEIIRPSHSWCKKDWFEHDPCSDEEKAPLYYGRSLVSKIRSCPVEQEIGCHTFSHVIFGDVGCSRATAESELRACVELARNLGIELRSFAFPRNQVGHLDVLHQFGFQCYRGPEPVWHENKVIPDVVRRLNRLWEVLTTTQPPTVLPALTPSGLWNLPGSMIFFPMNGIRRFIPIEWRIKRALKGLQAAAQNNRVFHLWFHPTNLADQTEEMFFGLSRILERASIMRSRGELDICTMTALAITARRTHEHSLGGSAITATNDEDVSTSARIEL
jgi:peptidoglycan/xylan/chitin deacetylase (PgdA/CDA1 family)